MCSKPLIKAEPIWTNNSYIFKKIQTKNDVEQHYKNNNIQEQFGNLSDDDNANDNLTDDDNKNDDNDNENENENENDINYIKGEEVLNQNEFWNSIKTMNWGKYVNNNSDSKVDEVVNNFLDAGPDELKKFINYIKLYSNQLYDLMVDKNICNNNELRYITNNSVAMGETYYNNILNNIKNNEFQNTMISYKEFTDWINNTSEMLGII